MSEKKKAVYAALLDGATSGLTDDRLYAFVLERCPGTSSKRIVRASLLALSDPNLRDRNILSVIYALAIKHRLEEGSLEDAADTSPFLEGDVPAAIKPATAKIKQPAKVKDAAAKKKLASPKAAILPLPSKGAKTRQKK